LRPSPPPVARRRPMSPSNLRELDLSHTPDMPPRKYPAPPTGHDLMAMFPPAPPDNFEMRPGPTSDFFKRQERAFFAQAGKEIVRVRVEVDFPHGNEPEVVKQRPASRPWPLNGPGPGPSPSAAPHHSPAQSSSAPLLYPHPATRPAPRVSVPINPSPMFPPLSSHTPTSNQLPPNLHPTVPHQAGTGPRTPPEDAIPPNSKSEYTEEYDDEAWRKPMPYAERRRAGKHTRRVIVRT